MNFKKELRKTYGYDLIDSPIRNHKPLQLWLKKPSNPVELYYENILHALISDQKISIIEDNAFAVDHTKKLEYKFNLGITVLDELLTSLGLGNLGLNTKFNKGKKVSLSYDRSKTLTVVQGELANFLSNADFIHPNRELLRNANRNNIIVITGVIMAKNIKAIIETNTDLNIDLDIELNNIAEGKVTFSRVSESKIEMISEGNSSFPIAVKASKIDWDDGEYDQMRLITDHRNLF
ncbi:hypothetical protein D1816_23940 [Aquimarina sp. AD10]|uniref:Gasdermin bGSDM n=1 Tax=Aquimarina aggregata TaxID=1642818 RepID=A0A162CPX3_9FLAO|nr:MULTISPECIES: hypothetical protein [Aquimarina]AXT63265.1 hypothetical protein D1816_23940 [Aquimarina sp. AD10]KZS40404.1 hypothetical protein AWE51_05475 [Aquimarina aggregata]RKN00722.1 hypothetical protein D7033_07755 [Aquimarina sp. AD10]